VDDPRGLWVYPPLYDRATYERTGPREASVVYVGLDVHKDSIVIAVAREGREAAENWKTIPNDAVRSQKALKWLLRTGEPSRVGIAHRFLAGRGTARRVHGTRLPVAANIKWWALPTLLDLPGCAPGQAAPGEGGRFWTCVQNLEALPTAARGRIFAWLCRGYVIATEPPSWLS